ncbi:MAG: VOC family protein [Rhizobiaceae bacterium]|nr:VOC family protein [Rhizobiaceae bacterium]
MSEPGPNARISMISLGVEDLSKSTQFYQALGWVKSPKSQEKISFMKGNNIVLGLYGRASLAQDAGVENAPTGFSGIALALNLPSETDVDNFAKLAATAGGNIVKKPQKVFWGGYSGYFSDLDGHLWEIAHNPFVEFDANGNLDLDGEQAQ